MRRKKDEGFGAALAKIMEEGSRGGGEEVARDHFSLCATEEGSGVPGVPDTMRGDPYRVCESPCLDCGGRTWAVPMGPRWYVSPYCHDCAERSSDGVWRREGARRDRQSEVQRLRNAGLTASDLATTHQLLEPLKTFRSGHTPDWIAYLYGQPGTGKTTQLTGAVRFYAGCGWRCRYLTMSGMLRLLRPDGGLKVEDLVELDLLAIDEWGERGRMSEWATQQIRSVIDGRYRRRKATIIASNFAPKEIQKREDMGGWVIGSRIAEGLEAGEGRYITLDFDHRIGRPVPAER